MGLKALGGGRFIKALRPSTHKTFLLKMFLGHLIAVFGLFWGRRVLIMGVSAIYFFMENLPVTSKNGWHFKNLENMSKN